MKKAMRGLLAFVLVITLFCSYGRETVYARELNTSGYRSIYEVNDFYGMIDLEVDAGQQKGFNFGYYVYARGKDYFIYQSSVDDGLDVLTYTGTFTISGIGLSSAKLTGEPSASVNFFSIPTTKKETISSFYGTNSRNVEYTAYGAVITRFSHTMDIEYRDVETAYSGYGINNPKAGNFSYSVDMTVW